jgi:hypothetical protein
MISDFEPGKVYHQEFRDGSRCYFKALAKQKNGAWAGLTVDHPKYGKPKQYKGATAQGLPWAETPDTELPRQFQS